MRATSPGWRDPRLWIGIVIVAASVVVGARVLAAADDSVAVWALRSDAGPGEHLTDDDLVEHQVRFDDDGDLDRYFEVSDPLPDDLTLLRGAGKGELLPRSALGGTKESDTVEVSLEVSPGQVPRSVTTGSTVDVYLVAKSRPAEPALAGVTVVDVPAADDTFAPAGLQQVVVAVPSDDVAGFYKALGGLDDPLISIVRRD